MLTLIAFVVALGLLIAIHEYGHYRVAVACGVKVLRFSVGFGKPLLSWRRKGSPTEFVLCALPMKEKRRWIRPNAIWRSIPSP
jgi:regulator of sigma E protease